MSEALIDRLRDSKVSTMHPTPRRALELEAAGRIEQLERERDEARRYCASLRREIDFADTWTFPWEKQS